MRAVIVEGSVDFLRVRCVRTAAKRPSYVPYAFNNDDLIWVLSINSRSATALKYHNLDQLQTFQIMAKISCSYDGDLFQYWSSDQSYIHIMRYANCKYLEANQPPHVDTLRYFYKIDKQFFLRNRVFGQQPLILRRYIEQILKDKKISFQDPYNVLFLKMPCQHIRLMEKHEFCPFVSLYQAIGAAKIIKHIQLNDYQDIVKEIQNLWSKDDIKKMTPVSMKSAKRAISVLKGMFSFEDALQSNYKYHLNQQVFTQNRLIEGLIEESPSQKWMVYHPTSITHQIFKVMSFKNIFEAQRSSQNIYIHGQGGIGKSTSFSLLVGLHNIIQNYRLNRYFDLKLSQLELSNESWLHTFPKYFYYNLSRGPTQQQQLFATLRHQLPLRLKLLAYQDKQRLSNHIIKNYLQDKKQTVLIIDQINILFSAIRRINSKSSRQQKLAKEIFYSIQSMLQGLPTNLRVAYGSSENAEISLIKHMPQEVVKYKLNLKKEKILHHYKDIQPHIIKEILSIIQFQNINIIIKQRKEGYFENMQYKRNEYIQVSNRLINQKPVQNEKGIRGKYYQVLYNRLDKKGNYTKTNEYYQILSRRMGGKVGETPDFFSQFTHERVKQYFLKNQSDQTSYLVNGHSISGFFQLIDRMYWFTINQFSERYRKFIQEKGQNQEQMFKKYRMLTQIRIAAFKYRQERRRQRQWTYFQYQIPVDMKKQYQFELIFKEHAEIEDEILTIFLSPSTFIEATHFMEQKESFLSIITDIYVQDFCDQPDWFGKAVENTSINLMYGQNIQLQLDKVFQKVETMGLVGADFKFGHFYKLVTQSQKEDRSKMKFAQVDVTTSIEIRFSLLWNQMDEKKVPINYYVCAKSCLMSEGKLQTNKFSTNSQAIDLLFIKKVAESKSSPHQGPGEVINQKFQLLTFDYCMAFGEAYIKNKIANASLFFQKMMLIAEKEKNNKPVIKSLRNNYTIYTKRWIEKVSHVIILPQIMIQKMQLDQIWENGFSIQFAAIQKMNIKIISPKQSQLDIMILRRFLMASLLKAVERKSISVKLPERS